MKVALIGSHGLGKTALCYDLVARLKREGVDADMVKEVARSCPLPVNQATSVDAQRWILCTQMAKEIETAARCAITVCDRSVLDNYAYLVLAHKRQWHLELWLNEWLHTYDLLVYLPVVGVAQADGFRDVDRGFIDRVDFLLKDLLDEHGVNPLWLDRDTRDSWPQDAYRAVKALWEKSNGS